MPYRTSLAIRLAGSTLALAIAVPHAALAEEAAAPEIVVSGRGLDLPPAAAAYNTVEIGQERIAASASGRIEDALGAVAGLQQFRRSDSRSSNPSAQGITMRALGGNASSRSLVLLDGVPQADPFFGYIPLSAIDPAQLAGARVTRGGGAGAFGSGAVAGTVELASGGPSELGLARGSLLVNDRGETDLSAGIAPRLGQGFAVLSGQWNRGQGFWTTPPAQRSAASVRARFDVWSAGLRAVTPLTPEIELQARIGAFDDHRTLRFAGAFNTSSGQDASLRLVGRGAWAFEALGYVQARNFSSIVMSSSTFRKTLDQYATPSTGLGGKFELRPPVGGAHVLRLGSDFRIARGTASETAFNANLAANPVTARRSAGGRNSDVGFYAEDDWSLGPVVLTGGVRADRWTVAAGMFREANAAGTVTTNTLFAPRSGWETSARGGALVKLSNALSLRASAYSGIRQPTLNELYRPFQVFPVRTQANAALGNERLEGFEVGFDFTPVEAVKMSVTAYDNRVKNAIANVTIGTNLRERRNVDAVRSRGVEASAGLNLGTVSLDASLALTDAEVRASGTSLLLDGKRPAQTPRVAASATAAWAPRPDWRIAVMVKHTGAQYEDDLQTDLLPAATTLDGFVAVPLRAGFDLVLRAENITDVAVVTRNQGGSIDYGAPRTVWAGVRVKIR